MPTSSLVVVSGRAAGEIRRLALTADRALAQSRRVMPGSTREIRRYEDAMAAIERLARDAQSASNTVFVPSDDGRHGTVAVRPEDLGELSGVLDHPAMSAVAAGAVVVELRSPYDSTSLRNQAARPVADRWTGSGAPGLEAARERFEHMLADVVNGVDGTAIVPCGVPNRFVTTTLHTYVFDPDLPLVEAAVRYRDGSTGPSFRLGGLASATVEVVARRDLRVALMSLRHQELDHVVDGAWLRNVHVSTGLPHGEIDREVHQRSLAQLDALVAAGSPVEITMYQTGFAPAIMGFYRAVADHLRDRPGTLRVRPRHHGRGGRSDASAAWEAS